MENSQGVINYIYSENIYYKIYIALEGRRYLDLLLTKRRSGTPDTPSAQPFTTMANITFTESKRVGAGSELFQGVSPWQDGVKFRITGSAYRSREGHENEDALPVLVTTIGDLFLSTLLRSRVDDKGQRLVPNGTLNQKLVEVAGTGSKTKKEVLDAMLAATAGKDILTKRKDYVGMRGDGSRYPASYLEFDIL